MGKANGMANSGREATQQGRFWVGHIEKIEAEGIAPCVRVVVSHLGLGCVSPDGRYRVALLRVFAPELILTRGGTHLLCLSRALAHRVDWTAVPVALGARYPG